MSVRRASKQHCLICPGRFLCVWPVPLLCFLDRHASDPVAGAPPYWESVRFSVRSLWVIAVIDLRRIEPITQPVVRRWSVANACSSCTVKLTGTGGRRHFCAISRYCLHPAKRLSLCTNREIHTVYLSRGRLSFSLSPRRLALSLRCMTLSLSRARERDSCYHVIF